MPEEPGLPELARSLRTFGDVHDPASEAAHGAVFSPLLDARARAAISGRDGALDAFRGQALSARILARASDAARSGETDPARARARVARAREALEPLRAGRESLDSIGATVRVEGPGSAQYSLWLQQLAHVFRLADDSCRALARLLAEPIGEATHRDWLGRPRR
jgi:hypothetical protein